MIRWYAHKKQVRFELGCSIEQLMICVYRRKPTSVVDSVAEYP